MLDLSRLFLEGWAARVWRSGIWECDLCYFPKIGTKNTRVGHFSLVLMKTLGGVKLLEMCIH